MMYYIKKIFFVLCLNVLTLRATQFLLENRNIILINIFYAAIQRAKHSMAYIKSFSNTYQTIMEIHDDMLIKIKNPAEGLPYFRYNTSGIADYQIIINQTEEAFYQYEHILNNLYFLLTPNEKKIWHDTKATIKENIIKEILQFNTIADFLYKIYSEYKTQTRFSLTLPNNINELWNSYKKFFNPTSLYQFFYSYFHTLQEKLHEHMETGYDQFLKIWLIIEQKKINHYTNIYNTLLLQYFQIHNKFPKKIIYQKNHYQIETDLCIL